MKNFLMIMLSVITTLTVTAQNITITFNGTNKNINYQAVLDGTSYYSNSSIDPANEDVDVRKQIFLKNQQTGSHTISIYRLRNNNTVYTNGTNTRTYGRSVYSNTFQLKEGYNMDIKINGNGQISFTENRGRNRGNKDRQRNYNTAMTDAAFSQLLQDVRSKWLQSAKVTLENDAFTNTNNYFSTEQVRQLLLLISSESNRLALAKSAYLRVIDPENFTMLYNVFNSISSRDEMNTYIRNNNNNNNNDNDHGNWNNNNGSYKTPMADYQFSQLLQSVNSEYYQNNKIAAISNAFNITSNYFSTTQIRQLLSLITSDNEKLTLAKLSYARVTDQSSFSTLSDLFYSQSIRQDFNNFVNANGNNNNGSYAKTPMADYQFSQLIQSVNDQYYQANKVSTINNAISTSNTYFSTAQIRQLLSLISAENDRLILAKLAYLRVSDPPNFTSLYDLFYNQSSKNDLNNYVIQNGGNGSSVQYNTKPSMDNTSFSQLLQKASNHFFPWDKVRDVREDFSNTSYYFSTSQIRQLLSILTSESDRLELAKLAWSRVTDPSYFTQLFDLFTIQAYRDDLNAYIQAHPY